MKEEIRELSDWFKGLQKIEEGSIENLPEEQVYGKGIKGVFAYTPKFKSGEPEYFVRQIDKELELYTLIEATQTLGINDLLKGLFQSPLLPKAKTKLDAALFSNIKNGLVVYAQPKISDEGELLVHNINLETKLKDGSTSDLVILIVKTGARLNLEHEFVGGVDNSMLGRKVIVVCEDGAMVRFKENINNVLGAISVEYIFLVGPESNVTFVNTAKAKIILRQNIESYLLGDGSNSSIENVYKLNDESKYDILCLADLKSSSAHSTIHTVSTVEDKSHLIYRSGIVSQNENNGSVDEARLLLVGSDSKIDSLPAENAHSIRQITTNHLDTIDNLVVEQLLGRVIDVDHLKEIM